MTAGHRTVGPRLRRLAAVAAATSVGVAAMIAAGIAEPAAACACGGMAPPLGGQVSVGEEHAIVSYADGIERIDVLLGVLTDQTETGLIFPTPTPASVTLGDRALFDALDRQLAPERVVEEHWWSLPSDAAGAAPPEVLARVDLGPVVATTLAASDAAGLTAWLDENGYGISPQIAALLPDYVERGWSFVALQLTGDAPLDGELDPLRFEFAAEGDQLVYPLLLSQAASTPQTLWLSVLGDERSDVSFLGDPGGDGLVSASWAGPVDEPELAGLGEYLTVFQQTFGDPGTEIRGDLAITSTGARDDDIPVAVDHRYVTFAGIPAGYVLLFGGIALALATIVVVVVRRSRRGTS